MRYSDGKGMTLRRQHINSLEISLEQVGVSFGIVFNISFLVHILKNTPFCNSSTKKTFPFPLFPGGLLYC
jgi:hypothetical protein